MIEFNYDIVTVDVQGSPMEVFLFSPEGDGPHPGIVLAQHIPVGHTGIENDTFTLTTAQRFADSGYAVAVPFIFHWWAKTDSMDKKKEESRDDWMILDMKAAFELLCAQESVDTNKVAMAGHCWGGRVAWLAACHINRFKALAVFYGGNIKKGLGEGSTAPALTLEREWAEATRREELQRRERDEINKKELLKQEKSPILLGGFGGETREFFGGRGPLVL